MKYRAEIDGLRALAVVPVILFHAGFDLFKGGFVGVDVFFVISGYLITSILIEDIEDNNFSLVNFYERRARRILPALFFVMFTCTLFAVFWMLPNQMRDFSQSLVAVSLFGSNILFWRESGYWAAAAEEKPLLHTWSLAVEEQYYLVFPIFLILAWRFGSHRVFVIIMMMTIMSLLLSEWGWRYDSSANFYLSPTRAWELFAGSLAACWIHKHGTHKNGFISIVGLSAIIFSILIYDENIPFPSIYTLLPVIGVVLIVLFADDETWTGKILSGKILVGIGLISYSAYLWHQPLFAFARIRLHEPPSFNVSVVLIFITLALAYVSWRYLEKPFRDRKIFSARVIFGCSAFGIIFFTSVGLVGHFSPQSFEKYWLSKQEASVKHVYGLIDSSSSELRDWNDPKGDEQDKNCIFNVQELDHIGKAKILECRSKLGAGILVLGDSHAIDLFGVIASRREHQFLVGVAQGGCRPHQDYESCHLGEVTEFLKQNPGSFRLVIYEQAGFYLLRDQNGTSGSRKLFSDLAHDEPVTNVVLDKHNIEITTEFLVSLANLTEVTWFLPRVEPHIASDFILRNGCDFNYSLRPNLYETFLNLDKYIEELVQYQFQGRINVVSQNRMFDFKFPEDFISCSAIYWSDGDHLSGAGEKRFGQRLSDGFIRDEQAGQ